MKIKKILLIALLGVFVFSTISATTLYYSESCPYCEEVLNSEHLFKIPNLNLCPLSNEDCLDCYKEEGLGGVPALITEKKSIGGSKNIIDYAKQQPYFSKIPTEQDDYLETYELDDKTYKLYETPSGNKFLGGYTE